MKLKIKTVAKMKILSNVTVDSFELDSVSLVQNTNVSVFYLNQRGAKQGGVKCFSGGESWQFAIFTLFVGGFLRYFSGGSLRNFYL